MVLHSPMLSGVRVFNPNLRWWPAWADIFPNHLLVKKIDVPLLVMHGTADEVCRRVQLACSCCCQVSSRAASACCCIEQCCSALMH